MKPDGVLACDHAYPVTAPVIRPKWPHYHTRPFIHLGLDPIIRHHYDIESVLQSLYCNWHSETMISAQTFILPLKDVLMNGAFG